MFGDGKGQRSPGQLNNKEVLQCRIQDQLAEIALSESLTIIRDRVSQDEKENGPLFDRQGVEDIVATVLEIKIGEMRGHAQSAATNYVISELKHGVSKVSPRMDPPESEAVDLLKRDLLRTLYEEHDKLEKRIHQWTEEVRQLPCYSDFYCDADEDLPASTTPCVVTQRARRTHVKPNAPTGDSMEETGPISDTPVVDTKKLSGAMLPSNETGPVDAGEVPEEREKFGFDVHGSIKLRRESDLEKYIQNTSDQCLPLQFIAKQIQALQEPPRKGCFFKFVNSDKFEKVCLLVIILNIVYIFNETNYSMANKTEDKSSLLKTLELAFATYYFIEITLKLLVHRLYFFCNEELRWNLFDFFLVVIGTAELIVRYSLNDVFVLNPTFLRMFRILRISKIFRIIRLLRFFNELRLLLKCVMGSFMSLFWSCVLLMVFTVVFAIIFVQQLAQYIVERRGTPNELTPAEVLAIEDAFGSVQLATLSLFKGMSGGNDWDAYYQMVSKSGYLNGIIFLFYICFVWLSVTNIITSVFVDKAMKLALPDVDELLLNKHKEELESAKELKRIVIDLDVTDSSSITLEELQRCMQDVRFATYLELKGLDIKDAELFFRMLLDMSDCSTVDINTFIGGCLKMKGLALNIDLLSLSYQTSMLHKYQTTQFGTCLAEMHRIAKQLEIAGLSLQHSDHGELYQR